MALLELDGTPARWSVVRIGDVLDLVRGASPRPKGDPRYFGGDIPWVLISDVTREPSKYVRTTRESVTKAGAELSRLLPKGTLILTNSATVGVPKFLGVDACIHDGFIAFPHIPDWLSADFFFEYFRALRPVILREIRQGVTQVNLNTDIVRDMRLPIPPINEQRRIVAKLETLQSHSRRAREALDAVPPLLEKLRQSILAAAFRGDLTKDWRAKHKDVEPASELLKRIRVERRKKWEEAELAKMKAKGKSPKDDRWKAKYKEPEPVDATELPALPEGWCWASVEELSHRVTDGTHQSPAFIRAGVPFIVIADVIGGAIDLSTVTKWVSRETYEQNTARCRPQRGDVLYTAVGSYGVALTVDVDEPFMFQRHIAHIKPLGMLIRPDALAALLNAPQTKRRADQVARGVAQKTVTLGELCRFPIPVAPREEQNQLIESIEVLVEKIRTQKSELGACRDGVAALDRAILAKAFRGELVPQDPNDESADAMLARRSSCPSDKAPRPKRFAVRVGS